MLLIGNPASIWQIHKSLNTVDRGHLHKGTGRSVISIWVRRPQAYDAWESSPHNDRLPRSIRSVADRPSQGKRVPERLRLESTQQQPPDQFDMTTDDEIPEKACVATVGTTSNLIGEWRPLPDSAWRVIYDRFHRPSISNEAFSDLSDDELVSIALPHVVERCDMLMNEVKNFFDQGGCTVDEIVNAGIDKKIVEGLLNGFHFLQNRLPAIASIRTFAQQQVTNVVGGWVSELENTASSNPMCKV